MFAPTNLRNPNLAPIGPITYTLGRRPDKPPCTCFECAQQYRMLDAQSNYVYCYTGAFENDNAAAVCNRMVQIINGNRAYLQYQLALRGVGIAKRWKKKTSKNREGLLKSIDPSMYERKWHEGHILYDSRYDNWLIEARKYKSIHLLPYMSLENLKEDPSRVIKLLQHRAKYSPEDLATHDSHRMTFGWTAGILQPTYNGQAMVMHGPHYGSLVPWDSEAVHRGDTIGFPRGQMILEAQSHLITVLRGLVEVLVDGLPEDTVSTIPIGPSSFEMRNVDEASVYLDEAFLSCPNFDLEKLKTISKTRLNIAKDHFFQLQTDPAYMRRYVQLIQDSQYAQLAEKAIFVMTTQDLDYEAWTIRHWAWISEELSELKQIRDKFADQINRGQPLPRKYRNKLAFFEALILRLLDIQSRLIQCNLAYRPGFQHQYKFTETIVGGSSLVSHAYIDRKEDLREQAIVNAESFVKDPLHWCISSLTTDPDSDGVWDKLRLLELLEQHLAKASAEERARMDETLYRKISDLAAFNELLNAVRCHRPRAPKQPIEDFKIADQSTSVAWRFMNKTTTTSGLNENMEKYTVERTLQEVSLQYYYLGPLLKAFMDLDPPKDMSDRSWMKKDIAQRKELRCFWDQFRQQHQKRLKDAKISRADIEDDLKLISGDSDPTFLAALEAGRREFLTASVAPSSHPVRKSSIFRDNHASSRPQAQQAKSNAKSWQELQGLVEPVHARAVASNVQARKDEKLDRNEEMQTEWGTTPEGLKPTGVIKVKAKTRDEKSSIAYDIDDLNIEDPSDVDNQEEHEKVPVKKSAFEVLTSLWPRRGGTKSILWDRFVDAMAKVGFMSRNSGGSAVTFEPVGGSKWYGQGSIVFHRPHPVSTIDPVMLISIGKRMKKWFGWGNGTFELARGSG